jgi:hypothetical protein
MAAGAFVYVTANLERHGNAQLAPTYAGPASLARALGVHVRTIKRWKAAAKVLELVDVENHRHPDCDRWNLTSRLHYRFRPGSRGAELLAALLDARDLARQRSRAGLKAPRTEPPPEPPAVSWVECPACSNVSTGHQSRPLRAATPRPDTAPGH